MGAAKRTLIVPIEEQSRELDAKLLLGCVAAERGFPVILGSRHAIHLRVARLPRGIYYAKSFRPISLRMFEILAGLGHEIVACDEEALRPYPDEIYFQRRMSPRTLEQISALFAWGDENAALFQRYPGYDGTPIHTSGNPRADLLRPELRSYYEPETEELRERYGDFVLFNTNFGAVNHRVQSLRLVNQPAPRGDDYPEVIQAHKSALFEHFRAAVAALARTLPGSSIVVRPHPVEDHAPWLETAAGCANVHVVHEGSVVPWLLAARALVQNNCTTALEAALLGRPVVSYRPTRSERFDDVLCAAVGHDCANLDDLTALLRDILTGRLAPRHAAERTDAMKSHIASQDGPLACERIVDVLEQLAPAGSPESPEARQPRGQRLRARMDARLRTAQKRALSLLPGSKHHRAYQEHRFPPLAEARVQARIDRFSRTLDRFGALSVEPVARDIFRIAPARRGG